MNGRRENRLRRKVRLHVELLEDRVAPVVVNALTPLTFTDASGDLVTVTMAGSGQVDIYDSTGAAPAGSDIAVMYFSGTTGSSFLMIEDTNLGVGGDDLTGGTSVFLEWKKTQLGGMTFNAGGLGTVQNTYFDEVNCLNLYVQANLVTACDFSFGTKTVNNITMDANMVTGTTISSLRSVKYLGIGDDLSLSTIRIGQDVTLMEVSGAVGNMTEINVMRKAVTVNLQGGMDNSSLFVGSTAQTVSITGPLGAALANMAFVEVGRDTKTLNIYGDIDASQVFLRGKAGTINVMGDVMNGSTIDVRGPLKEMMITSSVMGHSVIQVSGAVTTLGISFDVVASTIELSGNAKSVLIGRNLGWDAAGAGQNSDLWVAGNATLIQINGNVLGDPGDGGANPRIVSHFEVEGTLGTLTILGAVRDSELYGGANAKSIVIGENVPGGDNLANSLLDVREKVKSVHVVGNILDGSMIRANALQSCVIDGDMTNSQIFIYDDAKLVNVNGAFTGSVVHVYGSASTVAMLDIGAGSIIDVRGELKTFAVAQDVGAGAYMQVGSLVTGTVGGLVYGNIDVYGTLGSILTNGTDATPTATLYLPFTSTGGAMAFMDDLGVATGGVVQYMTLTGVVS